MTGLMATEQRCQFLRVTLAGLRKLGPGWRTAKLMCQFVLAAQALTDVLDDMHRQTNIAGVIHDGSFDALPYPPRRVCGKSATALRIILVDCPHETDIAFFNQVEQAYPPVSIT